MPREALLNRTFVELADTLVDDFDVVDLLTLLTGRCVEILDVDAAGVMLSAADGGLALMASSNDTMRLLELFELQHDEGPCLDAYRGGGPVLNEDLAAVDGRWPRFAPVALEAGFRTVHALPLRLRGTVVGALNLFQLQASTIEPADVVAAQAMAAIGTIAILQQRAAAQAQLLNEQLASALDTRVLIEQAKGVFAERVGLTMEEAFARLRRHARSHNLLLADVARKVIEGTLPTSSIDP